MSEFKENIHYSIELEKQVLGAMMLEKSAFGRCVKIIEKDVFYRSHHQQVFEVISEMWHDNEPIDITTVYLKMLKKGIDVLDGFDTAYYVTVLTKHVTGTAHLEYHALLLRQMYVDREIISITSTSPKGEGFKAVKEIEDRLRKLRDKVIIDDFKGIDEILTNLHSHMDSVSNKELSGITTGFKNLDRITGGLQQGGMYIVAARPSVGKSAFMGKMVFQAAAKGVKVGIVSLEMTDNQIAARLSSLVSEIDYWRIYRNRLIDQSQKDFLYEKINELSRFPIMISDATGVNISDIKAKVARLMQRGQLDILFIDYLQLLDPEQGNKNYNREQEVSKISRGLKLCAKDHNIPIVVLAQLNRGSELSGDKKPKLHHLRESGSLEQDADGVIFLHRDFMSGIKTNDDGGNTENEADIIIAKWRDGEVTEYKVGYDGPKMKFYELDQPAFKPISDYNQVNPF